MEIMDYDIHSVENVVQFSKLPIYAFPYPLWKMTIGVYICNNKKPLILDVALSCFYDRVPDFELNNNGYVWIDNLNLDFWINDYEHVQDNGGMTMETHDKISMTMSAWEYLKTINNNIQFKLLWKLKETMNKVPELRKDIVDKYKEFQMAVHQLFEPKIDNSISQFHRSLFTPILLKEKKIYLNSDIFYFDVEQRYREQIINNSPYSRYISDELQLYDTGRCKNNPHDDITKYLREIIIDIWCGTWEKAKKLINKSAEKTWNQEQCYVWFDSNELALYDTMYAMSKSDSEYFYKNEKDKREKEVYDKKKVSYLFSDGRLQDIMDGSIKLYFLPDDEMESFEKWTLHSVVHMQNSYKNIFIKNDRVAEDKKNIMGKMWSLMSLFNKKEINQKEFVNGFMEENERFQSIKDISVNVDEFKKTKKTIVVPGGTFGNFIQNDKRMNEYIQRLEERRKRYTTVQSLPWDQLSKYDIENVIYLVDTMLDEAKEKNNWQRMFLQDMKKCMFGNDVLLLTVFSKPSKDDPKYYKKIKEIENLYNDKTFKDKYLCLFKKSNIPEKDIEYSAKYEDDDKIHIYIRVKNSKWIFFPISRGQEIPEENKKLQEKWYITQEGKYTWFKLPYWFTFHCQSSQRFSDEDMQNIVELDGKGNQSGLKIIDQIIDSNIESMKIYVVGLTEEKKE